MKPSIRLISAFFLAPFIVQAQPAADPSVIIKFNPETTTILYKLGETTIPIKVMQYGEVKNIVCINLHDNENTSVNAAQQVLETRGGTLIKIENYHQRVIKFRFHNQYYSFDPNRIFSKEGIEQSLKENRRSSPEAIEEVYKFAERILQIFPEEINCVIALHNNTEGAYSIKSYQTGSEREKDAKAIHTAEEQDIDDIALTTDEYLFQQMASNGYNSIWQDNINVKKDGSLSVYCGEKNQRYINIETQHGRMLQYKEMLEKLLDILNLKEVSVVSGE